MSTEGLQRCDLAIRVRLFVPGYMIVILVVLIMFVISVVAVVMIVLILLIIAGLVLVRMRRFLCVEVPDAFERRQNQAIDDRSGRLEHTHNAIRMRLVTGAAFFEPVRSRETRSNV